MLYYRTFRNTDPPLLTALWQTRAGQRGFRQSITVDLFEQLVFAKLYFDYRGLILAFDDDRLLGFAHAGFGPNEHSHGVSTQLGVTAMILVRPDCEHPDVPKGLLERSESYLRERGAKVLYGGGIQPLNPFYLGMYGGSELPGILQSDHLAQQLYRSGGYTEIDQTYVFHHDLNDFEAPIDRRQMQVRRQMLVEVTEDPPPSTWWEASTLGEFDLTRFDVIPRSGGPPIASVLFRSMEPTGTVATLREMGLVEFHVEESFRRRGVAVFLMSEAFRQFLRQGVVLVEAQCMCHNAAAIGLYEKLGFQKVNQGSVFRRSSGA